ncbi:MAG: HdeD family acid-resistance protein [Sphingomonas sp.]|nr:HdeD family acid-resistance protein [Sphingomonas sp.]
MISFGRPTAAHADAMHAHLARHWWALLLRGVLGILLGILTLALPAIALGSLIILFAAYMLADGLLGVVSAIRAAQRNERWGWLLVEGMLGIIAGLIALFLPGAAALSLVLLASVWAIVSGAALLTAGVRLRRRHGRIWMVLAGMLSIIWGVLLFIFPGAGAIVLTLWIGAYAFVFGTMLLILAFRLRSQREAEPARRVYTA